MTAREMYERGEIRMREKERRSGADPWQNPATGIDRRHALNLYERRNQPDVSTLINCVIEEHRAPLVRFIRELGGDVARLELIVRAQARLLDQSQPAPHVCGVTTKARHGS